jgi:hypothetical protein
VRREDDDILFGHQAFESIENGTRRPRETVARQKKEFVLAALLDERARQGQRIPPDPAIAAAILAGLKINDDAHD